MTTHDDARRDAVDTITRYLIARDHADPADRADAEIDAAIIVQDLGRQGWRPTVARPVQGWQHTGEPAAPDVIAQHAAAARAALARPADTEETDRG